MMIKPDILSVVALQGTKGENPRNTGGINNLYSRHFLTISISSNWIPIILWLLCIVLYTLIYANKSEASSSAYNGKSHIINRKDNVNSPILGRLSQNIANPTISPKSPLQLTEVATYTVTAEIPPSSITNQVEPNPTATPNIIGIFVNESADSAAKTFGTISGVVIVLISLVLLLLLPGLLVISIGGNIRQLVLQAFQLIGGEWVEDAELVVNTQMAFHQNRENFVNDLSFLRGRIDYRSDLARYYLNLEKEFFSFDDLTDAAGLNFSSLMNAASPDPKDLKIQFSLGPLQFSGFSLPQKLLNPPFRLVINTQPSPPGKITLTSTLTWKDQVWYSKAFHIIKKERSETLTIIAREVAWALTRTHLEEIKPHLTVLPSEIQMILGIHEIARFMKNPRDISLLETAQEYFNEIAEKSDRWSFQARFLSLISRMLLTKSEPINTANLFVQLERDYSNDKNKQRILPYFVGQAIFYQYDRADYPKAIEYFEKINRPYNLLWEINRSVWWFILKLKSRRVLQELVLYYLAQCSIAITMAHQIDRRDKSDKGKEENENLKRKIDALVSEIMSAIIKLRPLIGNDIAEIQWRALNAKVMVAISLRQNIDEGIKAAQEALGVAPYALDMKANLGSLKIYSAALRTLNGEIALSDEDLNQANEIFEELERLGWDLGFVKYRLGIIRRVQGRYNDALQLFREAKNPNIRNVPIGYIDAEIKKAENNDNSNTLD
jgi:tetratricopeptide (TPR) repeat protein